MDFYNINVLEKPNGGLHIRPDWKVGRTEDLMTRGGDFYAIWDAEAGLWSTDIYDVQRLVDAHLFQHKATLEKQTGLKYHVDTMESNKTKLWAEFKMYLRNSGNSSHPLDETLVFANTEVKKTDYSSRRLPYALHDGGCGAWDQIVGTLYNEEERAKIEWAIGAVVSGDSKQIQKFLVFYGPPGSGKSTILNIIEKLFRGYTAVFDARELAGNNNSFAASAFKSNPLVAIQHDGDLSRIYDNTKLNSIVAHEILPVNEKYQKVVEMRANAFLFMGTNLPVKITDAKSGIIRRLIDVVPTGQKLEHDTYHRLMELVGFELGAVAQHCLKRYLAMGKNYYSGYRPTEMMAQTDVFYNFVEAYFDVFKEEDGVTLKKAWDLYKAYCTETGIEKPLPQYKMREHLRDYFETFEDRATVNGVQVRSYYSGFKHLEPTPPRTEMPIKSAGDYTIVLEDGPSIFDEAYPTLPAQYAGAAGSPKDAWRNVSTTLSDIDTNNLHWVKVPETHIVIDFDLKNVDGEKDLEQNLMEASKWPATYTELSQGGKGVHLHYLYYGDVHTLASLYSEDIEIKTLLGDAALRRRLTKCNRVTIATLAEGTLPKKEKSVLSDKSIQSERSLRAMIEANLQKKYHSGTKSSIDFIHKILQDAYESGMPYDVRDMRPRILGFAAKSSNQSEKAIKVAMSLQLVSETGMPEAVDPHKEKSLVFFDVEVFPNLLVICYKIAGAETVTEMVNPSPKEVEALIQHPLVGFNNRRYDNHILYARYLGWDLPEIYALSQKMVDNDRNAPFGEAYNLSYTDIYDFTTKKQGLKKYMIELGIHHQELDLPWDQPVAEELWPKIVDYCCNDVRGTEVTFESRKADFNARLILAELSGLTPNHTTQAHTAMIVFGGNRNPQSSFIYKDLGEEFPGYEYNAGESTYRGEIVGEGGYVYAEPGMYQNVALLDVASMHPTTIEILKSFGEQYTANFSALKDARIAIKCKDFESASTMLDGKLAPFLGDEDTADDLAYALKTAINIVYGLTAAKFDNAFRDIRNKDNVVAKRGALFMVDLKHEVQTRGFTVCHIKTDSIKIPNATQEIIDFVIDFGKKYGYDFELECVYDKFCLVNEAVYVAWDGDSWNAVGKQFQQPYVYKTLFSHEELTFDDYCETKHVVKGTMYLDFDGSRENMQHVGRTGAYVPVEHDTGAELLVVRDEKPTAVAGTKGYRWITRDLAADRDKHGDLKIDMSYFEELAAKAVKQIESFGNFEEFANQ